MNSKKKTFFKEKPRDQRFKKRKSSQKLQRLELIGTTEYLPFYNKDLMYFGNMHNLALEDFRMALEKISVDLSILLSYKYQDFWKELKESSTLKFCLESCLTNFPKKLYGRQIKDSQNIKQKIEQSDIFRMWKKVMKIVLFLYHRIACQSKKEEKKIIYDEWLLDIPKLLFLVDIYGDSNQKIINEIVNSVLRQIPQYKDDFQDFVYIIQDYFLERMNQDLMFEFNIKKIKNYSNFHNPYDSFYTNLTKALFTVIDIFNSFLQIYKFFPKKMYQQFTSNKEIQIHFFYCYCKFMQNITKRWIFDESSYKMHEKNMKKTHIIMIKYFIETMEIIDEIIKDPQNKYWKNGVETFTGICKIFVPSEKNKQFVNFLQELLSILVNEMPHRDIFILTKEMQNIVSEKAKQNILICAKIEKQIRSTFKKDGFGKLQIAELNLQSIPPMKDFNLFEERNIFNEVVDDFSIQNQFDDEFLIEKVQDKPKQGKKLYLPEYDDEPDFEERERFQDLIVLPPEQVYADIDNDNYNELQMRKLGFNYIPDLTIDVKDEPSVVEQQNGDMSKIIPMQHQNSYEKILDLMDETQNKEEQAKFQKSSQIEQEELTITECKNEITYEIKQKKEQSFSDLSFSKQLSKLSSNKDDSNSFSVVSKSSHYENLSLSINEAPKKKKKYKKKQ